MDYTLMDNEKGYSIKKSEVINYSHEEIANFHCYIYEWIDNLNFSLTAQECLVDWELYEIAVKNKIKHHGWEGTGVVELIWIPPFMLDFLFMDGRKKYDYFSDTWSYGLVLWHVKQHEDGVSFILSPIELNKDIFIF